MNAKKLPPELHAAHEWTSAAGELSILSEIDSEADARKYAAESGANWASEVWTDVPCDDAQFSDEIMSLWIWLRLTAKSTNLTIWAVTCPGDPHAERPAHFVSADAEAAIARYAGVYRGDVTRGIEANEVDIEELAEEADAAGDYAQGRDCRLAMAGDQAAMQRVCVALG
jgi:hypothetical protein